MNIMCSELMTIVNKMHITALTKLIWLTKRANVNNFFNGLKVLVMGCIRLWEVSLTSDLIVFKFYAPICFS